ncbi:UPF0496 protein [Musa troglodytarum]|uniref:UPF0496 protein n=1 Tax=Musa troglodytarum TaxID=320322 RepID=A0A9E7KLY6_9LILI|nr:UPF0496 protein [Musa troglodytarum]URE20120.1 UPF0496 protein [Musa troglodytarum]
MLCFGGSTGSSTRRAVATPSFPLPADPEEDEEGISGRRWRNRDAPTTSAAESVATSPASSTINLSREYTHAVTTSSFQEIWSKIHCDQCEGEVEWWDEEEMTNLATEVVEEGAPPSSSRMIGQFLRPDRTSIEEALRGAPPTRLARLVSDYFDGSEYTSRFCLSLVRAVRRARSLYAPIGDLIDLLPASTTVDGFPPRLTEAECDLAFDRLLEFDRLGNPFTAPSSDGSCSFQGLRGTFAELKQQLELRLLKASRRYRLMCCATRGSGACLIVSTIGLAVTGVVLATHALVTLVAAPALLPGGCHRMIDVPGLRKRQRDYIDQLEAASRGVYVINNDLDTIDRLVARLHATVESDRVLVRLGLESGKDQQHPIQEVLHHLRKNHPSFLHQLEDLEEHVCLYFLAVNHARFLLFRQIQQQPPPP